MRMEGGRGQLRGQEPKADKNKKHPHNMVGQEETVSVEWKCQSNRGEGVEGFRVYRCSV